MKEIDMFSLLCLLAVPAGMASFRFGRISPNCPSRNGQGN